MVFRVSCCSMILGLTRACLFGSFRYNQHPISYLNVFMLGTIFDSCSITISWIFGIRLLCAENKLLILFCLFQVMPIYTYMQAKTVREKLSHHSVFCCSVFKSFSAHFSLFFFLFFQTNITVFLFCRTRNLFRSTIAGFCLFSDADLLENFEFPKNYP